LCGFSCCAATASRTSRTGWNWTTTTASGSTSSRPPAGIACGSSWPCAKPSRAPGCFSHILYHASRCLRLDRRDELDIPLDDVRDITRATLEHLLDPRSPAPSEDDIDTIIQAGQNELEQRADDPDPGLFARPRPRLYLVDEPEQRLHPRLQRRAARWLSTLMSEWGSQCVLATHSLAFITPSPHLQAYQLARIDEPDSTEITPLNPATLTPYAQLAHDLGLDRGELLTRWRAFVFTDPLLALILDELAGEAFEQSDIRLIPLPAPGAHPPPEISLLADLTAAPLILLATDPTGGPNIWPSRPAAGAHRAPDAAVNAGSAASVLDLATQLELDIETLTLPIHHPLDLLHADAIRQAATSGAPPFPGHELAHQRHATANQQAPTPYPDFLHATYGISTAAPALHAIAQTMRHDQLPAGPELADVIWQIEQTALSAEIR